jgi:hypothetical protein
VSGAVAQVVRGMIPSRNRHGTLIDDRRAEAPEWRPQTEGGFAGGGVVEGSDR